MYLFRKQSGSGERTGARIALAAWRALAIVTALASAGTVYGQVHGVPPSITSLGSGGIAAAPRPSITSMGPYGWQNPPLSWQGFPRSFSCAVISSTSQSNTICVNPLLPGATGQAPFYPFGQSAFGPNGGFGTLIPGGGAFGYGRQGAYTGTAILPVGIPYGYAAGYPEPVPGEMVVAGELVEGQKPSAAVGIRLTNVPATAASPNSAPASASAPAVAGAVAATTFVPPQKSTVLVMRDGRRIEVGNYAIVGNQVVNMSGSPGRIPLSELDVPATAQANDDRGVHFSLPAPSRKDAKRQ